MENAALGERVIALPDIPLFMILAMVVALSFLTACAAIYLFRRVTTGGPSESGGADILLSKSSTFLFSGKNLVFVSSKGKSLLNGVSKATDNWGKLRHHLSIQDPDIGTKLDNLRSDGTPFFEIIQANDGVSSEVEGYPSKGFITVSIQKWSRQKAVRQAPNGAVLPSETKSLAAEPLPVDVSLPMWSRTKDGIILWSNGAFKDLALGADPEQGNAPTKMPACFAIPDKDAPIASRRVSINSSPEPNAPQSWYKLHEQITSDGSIFGYAQDAGDLVSVETTLNRFVATLTESFAQLSTGLAIFDANKRLSIFNPAIADLMQMDPGWLATQPGFRDFMSRVREGQMMPEQKTAADWKTTILEIEKGAEQGTLSEKWVLPSGQTFKVTGRPHPHGAMALMIEDISTNISLERQHRAEIEQTRATLDLLTEAVSVFDTTGALVYANSACADLWSFDPKGQKDQLNIVDMTANWGAACKPTPVWGDLREFVTGLDQRAAWTADVELEDGTALSAVFAPLPDGSTLTTFTAASKATAKDLKASDKLVALSRAHEDDVSIMELAIEHMREAVKTMNAGEKTGPLLLTNPSPTHIEETLSYADRLLLMRQDEVPRSDNGIDTLTRDLLALLMEKEAELSLSCDTIVENGYLASNLKRLLINIMLVTRTLVAPKEIVDLSLAEMEEGISISCMFKGLPDIAQDPEKGAGLTYRIMMRYLKELHGEGSIDVLDERDFIKISCTIPLAKAANPSSAQTPALIEA